jgi:hypothetical protein
MERRRPKSRVIHDADDDALVKALMEPPISDVGRVPAAAPPAAAAADQCNAQRPPAGPDEEADRELLGGPEADRDEFHLPFVRTVCAIDQDGHTTVLRMTDSDEHGSETSDSDGQRAMYPSDDSDYDQMENSGRSGFDNDH